MKKIRYVSDAQPDDIEKYGKYAKEKIKITYDTDNGYLTEDVYLDNPEVKSKITNYSNDLKHERNLINAKYLNKRIKYNAIMLGIAFVIFFTGIGLGNILISLGLNGILVSNLVVIAMALISTYGFVYVNQGKFYYKKEEMVELKRIATELGKCGSIEHKIDSLDKNELLDVNFKRSQIDSMDFRQRNLRRNYEMHLMENEIVDEAMSRINRGVAQKLKSNDPSLKSGHKFQNKIVLSDNLYSYKSSFKLTTKRLGKKIGRWFVEAFKDDVPSRYEEGNYVKRGEKRR